MAMATRRIVATSEGGGCPSRQSRPERLAFYQCPFMLLLEVVGPGGSLSTVLIATPYWRDASRRVSWQAAKATAGSSCDRTATALVHRLGTAGGGGGGELVSSVTEPKFEQCSFRSVLRLVYSLIFHMYFIIVSYSASFIFSIRLHIRPSSYFIELVIVGQ